MLRQDFFFFVCLGSLILSFTCNLFAYFKFHSDWRRLIGKLKQDELDCRDTAPLSRDFLGYSKQFKDSWYLYHLIWWDMMLSGNFYGSQIRHWIFWGLNFGTGIFFGFVWSPRDFWGFWFLPPFDHSRHLKSGVSPPHPLGKQLPSRLNIDDMLNGSQAWRNRNTSLTFFNFWMSFSFI